MNLDDFLSPSHKERLKKIKERGEIQNNFIEKLQEQRDKEMNDTLDKSSKSMIDSYEQREQEYLKEYPEAEVINFIEKETDQCLEIIKWGEKKKLQRERFFAINKYLVFLEECKELEQDNFENIDDAYAICSNHSATHVITTLLQLIENGLFNVESKSQLARIIKKHFRCNGKEKIKSAESLISKIRRSDRNTEQTLIDVRRRLSLDKDFYI
ncbi:hypothetical protein N9I98_01260 [Flavobacteriales bacterium]|jgi:hypothetical protein|nr:hypothetical protein [Flavobacteriales bacterium]